MLFNSLEFALFFPIVVALYFAVPGRWRTLLLLVSSCGFYMAFVPAYILILLVTILIDYVAGIYLEQTQGRVRLYILWASIVATCLVLFIFKYFNFFVGSFTGLAHFFGWRIADHTLNILLPIGLSFHTFQSLSYVVEVYRGHQKTERDFVTYATYVMFFPQLVAGPIERPQNLLHQFHETHPFDYARITSGLKRMAWGFFKKLVVADRLALYVNDVYTAPQNFNGLQLTIATVFFAYQIYCDFSGYSDIAIGTARILGFKLMENFYRPYHAASVSEFWRRWHISLSTWFRDYVYYPLGGNRVAKPRWMANILVTFGISGLWHGANWTYVIWGLLNGVYLICGALTEGARNRFFGILGLSENGSPRLAIRIGTTFVLTCAAWIVFRARNVDDAWYIMTHFTKNWDFHEIKTQQFQLKHFAPALAGLLILESIQLIQIKKPIGSWLAGLSIVPRWAVYLSFIFTTILLGVYQKAQFIYFQF